MTEDKKIFATPKVRKFARELGANVSQIKGTERKGRITAEDVKNFVKSNILGIFNLLESFKEYIIKNKTDYYTKLREVTENSDWEGWILYMLEMVDDTSVKALRRLKEVTNLMEQITKEIKEKLPKVYTKELVEILFRLPYTKRQFLIDAKLGTPKTVGNYLIELENEGFLHSEKVGKEKLYLNHRLMKVLEEI